MLLRLAGLLKGIRYFIYAIVPGNDVILNDLEQVSPASQKAASGFSWNSCILMADEWFFQGNYALMQAVYGREKSINFTIRRFYI